MDAKILLFVFLLNFAEICVLRESIVYKYKYKKQLTYENIFES